MGRPAMRSSDGKYSLSLRPGAKETSLPSSSTAARAANFGTTFRTTRTRQRWRTEAASKVIGGHANIALVHEWLDARAGSEILFEQIAKTFPDADLYALTANCLLYTSPSPRDQRGSRMPSSA